MRKLTAAEIEQLAGRPGVDRATVEGYLATVGDHGYTEECRRLEWEAGRQRWDRATFAAVRSGIDAAGLTRHAWPLRRSADPTTV